MTRLSVAKFPASIDLYIPRILGSLRKGTIINRFDEMNVGKITSINMHRKVNENNNVYFFAFITVRLYHTLPAIELMSHLNEFNSMKLTYDEERMQYWEVRTNIPRSELSRSRSRCPSNDENAVCSTNNMNKRLYNHWTSSPLLLSDDTYTTNRNTLGICHI